VHIFHDPINSQWIKIKLFTLNILKSHTREVEWVEKGISYHLQASKKITLTNSQKKKEEVRNENVLVQSLKCVVREYWYCFLRAIATLSLLHFWGAIPLSSSEQVVDIWKLFMFSILSFLIGLIILEWPI